jgi:hypothetical protein
MTIRRPPQWGVEWSRHQAGSKWLRVTSGGRIMEIWYRRSLSHQGRRLTRMVLLLTRQRWGKLSPKLMRMIVLSGWIRSRTSNFFWSVSRLYQGLRGSKKRLLEELWVMEFRLSLNRLVLALKQVNCFWSKCQSRPWTTVSLRLSKRAQCFIIKIHDHVKGKLIWVRSSREIEFWFDI